MSIRREQLAEVLAVERARHEQRTPRSRELFEQADHLFGRVPMTWMNKWSGGYPLYLDRARGNRVTDVDGNELIDLGSGIAVTSIGHAHPKVIAAVRIPILRSSSRSTIAYSVS